MENSVTLAMPQPQAEILPPESTVNMISEGRLCPLCSSEIRLFFINYNEKMLMCANDECEYPFGHEELQFFREDTEIQSDEELVSIPSKVEYGSRAATASVISTTAWSEIERLNRTCEADDTFLTNSTNAQSNQIEMKKLESQILKHLDDIKELNKELNCEAKDENVTIKTEKWLKSLKTIEEISGVKLLKPEEIGLLKKEEPAIGLGELRIDIDQGNENSMSSIKIEIYNRPMNREKEDPPV